MLARQFLEPQRQTNCSDLTGFMQCPHRCRIWNGTSARWHCLHSTRGRRTAISAAASGVRTNAGTLPGSFSIAIPLIHS
jgi:hypothetical protein